MSSPPKTYESDKPETCEVFEQLQHGKINIFDEMDRLERERDEARKKLEELNDRFVRKCVREAMLETRLAEKYGLRSELGAELGTTDEMDNDESLKQGLSAIRKLKAERDEARAQIKGWENKWKCAVEMAALAELKLDEEAAK